MLYTSQRFDPRLIFSLSWQECHQLKKKQGPVRWLPLGLVIGSYRKWETLFSKNLSVYWKVVSKKLFLYRILLPRTKKIWCDSWPKCIHHCSHFYDRCCILRNTLGTFGHIFMTAVVFSKRLEGNLVTFLWQMLDLAITFLWHMLDFTTYILQE